MRLDKTLLGILVGLFSASSVSALDPQLDSGGFREEDRPVAEEIATYSAEERHAALIAAGLPEDLLEVQQIQSGSADDFASLIDGFSREDQEQIWDLVRYPGLVADLARGGAKSDAELERIAQRYPEEVRAAIRSEGRERYATWVEVYALDLEAEQAFSSVIAKHPENVRSAFQRLRGRPDLMSLLVDNIGLATRLGAAYRQDPTRVEARFDTLHQEVAAHKSEQEKSWAKELQDPKAQEELRTAAREFAEDQGYDLDNASNGGTIQTRVVHIDQYVNANPYPYWFGYPSWYASPYWYPASVWSHVGFQFGGGNGFLQVGLPSPYFLGWYNNFYYGAGYGYGGYGGGYGYWNYPGSYYGGGYRNHHQFHSAHYYDDHRPRYLHGNRNNPSNHHGSGGSGHAFDGNRQASQGGSMNRAPNDGHGRGPGLDRSDRPGRNNSGGQSGGQPGGQPGGNGQTGSNGRQFRADPRHSRDAFGGAPGTTPDTSTTGPGSSANPRQHLQRRGGTYQDRRGTSGPSDAPRVERRQRSWQSRGAGGDAGDRNLRDGANPGRQQPPDVSSPPPSRFQRFDRADRRGGGGDQPSRSAWAGYPQSASQHSPRERPMQRGGSTELVRREAHSGGGNRGVQSFGGSAPPSVGRGAHGGGHGPSAPSINQGGGNGGGHRGGAGSGGGPVAGGGGFSRGGSGGGGGRGHGGGGR